MITVDQEYQNDVGLLSSLENRQSESIDSASFMPLSKNDTPVRHYQELHVPLLSNNYDFGMRPPLKRNRDDDAESLWIHPLINPEVVATDQSIPVIFARSHSKAFRHSGNYDVEMRGSLKRDRASSSLCTDSDER